MLQVRLEGALPAWRRIRVGASVDGGTEVRTSKRYGDEFGAVVDGRSSTLTLPLGKRVDLAVYERFHGVARVSTDAEGPQELKLDRGCLRVNVVRVDPKAVDFVLGRPFAASIFAVLFAATFFLGRGVCVVAFFASIWFLLELPVILGVVLTKALGLFTVPGVSFAAVRVGASLTRKGECLFKVDVDDFAIRNDQKYTRFKNFVKADNVQLRLKLDAVDAAKRVLAALSSSSKTTIKKKKKLSIAAEHLKGKDHYLTEKSSSDPFYKLFLKDRLVARSEVVPKNLNPEWRDLYLDEDLVDDLVRCGTIEVYDYDVASAPDLIGAGTLGAAAAPVKKNGADDGDSGSTKKSELTKRGAYAGTIRHSSRPCVTPKVLWSACPTKNAEFRRMRGKRPPPRLAVLGVELRVSGIEVNFDASEDGEVNVNNFARRVAATKVKTKAGGEPPNELVARVGGVAGVLKDRVDRVVLRLRGQTFEKKTNQTFRLRGSILETNDDDKTETTTTFDCADASAVVDVAAYSGKTLLGRWITTLKTLYAPPVFGGKDLDFDKAKGKVAGAVELTAGGASTGTFVNLSLHWRHNPAGKSHNEIAASRDLTALEQLEENSSETALKLGHLTDVKHVLQDFPVLFDVTVLELNAIAVNLKALFDQGYDKDDDDKAIHLDHLDLRDTLKGHVDLFTLLVNFLKASVGPVITNLHYADAISHVASGLWGGLFDDDDDDHNDDDDPEDDDKDDEETKEYK